MTQNNIEKLVRVKLEEMFGTKLRKRRLIIGYDSQKRPQIHEFDLVSDDMEIVGELKSGKRSITNYNLALVDCVYLSKIKARTKLMIFTNKSLYEYFKERSGGLIGKDIRVIFIPLDVHLNPLISSYGI
jgi:ABC-type microcin C transport system duplicated ATPase subunit YejF